MLEIKVLSQELQEPMLLLLVIQKMVIKLELDCHQEPEKHYQAQAELWLE